jgi:hypothetical protein
MGDENRRLSRWPKVRAHSLARTHGFFGNFSGFRRFHTNSNGRSVPLTCSAMHFPLIFPSFLCNHEKQLCLHDLLLPLTFGPSPAGTGCQC